MFDELFKLCLPTPYMAPVLTNVAVLLTLRRICRSEYSRIHGAISLLKIPVEQRQGVLKTLVNNVPLLLHATTGGRDVVYLFDLLTTTVQITGVYLSRDIATAVTRLGRLKMHPIITICSDILAWRKISPLSKLQASGTDSDSRFKTWKVVQIYGFLDSRMTEIESILASNLSTEHQTFDAVADAAIFMRKDFSPKLRSSASDCLFNYCSTSIQDRIFHEALQYQPSFSYLLEIMLIEPDLRERLPRNELYNLAMLWSIRH
ncbi:hypothetical protein B0H17DRAFT_1067131 [Mycena rosella]|uniref:Uncharacterized protein n=1 Tax=Mycena rosella TaxID=1033263 RepID=A0AAD7GHF9_MYCRO|nr:hypothetical protein B0H17DRAFT_1067131 [Mycena rosella]